MYTLGCCIPGASFMPQTGGEKAYAYDALISGYNRILDTGFDFAEATVGTLLELSGDELAKAADSGMVLKVCNSFVPPSLPLLTTDDTALREYVRKAMKRMALLSTEFVILGSGQARSVPKGIPAEDGLSRLESFLKICSSLYSEYGINVAIHNHPPKSKYARPETPLMRLKGRSDRLGVCADTGHWMRTGV
ncbi:MAG TPA: TIM barrel protein, partial [Clostridiales bacterium]|nr:TIM barrel protein [Clostridiales bacterium]